MIPPKSENSIDFWPPTSIILGYVGWKVCELIYWRHAIKPVVPCQEFWMDMLRYNGSKFAEESWRHFKSVRKLQKWHPADKSFALLGLKRPKTWRLAQEIHHGKPRESSLQLHKQGPRECRHETKWVQGFDHVWPTICIQFAIEAIIYKYLWRSDPETHMLIEWVGGAIPIQLVVLLGVLLVRLEPFFVPPPKPSKAQNVRNDENESLKGPKTVSATFQIHFLGLTGCWSNVWEISETFGSGPPSLVQDQSGFCLSPANGAPMAAMKKLLSVMAVLFSGLQGSMLDGHFNHQT